MFEGAYTAIVTPFNRDGSVDYDKLRDLVEWQIAEGISGLVPVGTTGESPTVDVAEHEKIIEVTIEAARRRVKIIAGTGANSTAEAIELTKHARDAGANGTLQVTPYYNRPNQLGLVRHFSAVADLGLPVVLYNVPGRTGREISVDTVVELAKHPKIVSVKEAGGSADRVSQYLARCKIEVLSGDDALTLPMMVLGAVGVISVASNVAPGPVADLVLQAMAGRWKEARETHYRLYRLFTDLFIDTNPVPVKAALAMMGKIQETYRLPLCETTEANKKKISECLKELKLI
ncbi:MAG TPA: 4-hydroxy-tetrahydrodipicolinate synthase [Kiritimatiellia bacterium]|jgi:4-hydroxy-tetrahydrodipicolinate synthase